MSRVLAGDTKAIVFHRPECFTILRDWLQLVGSNLEADAEKLLSKAEAVSMELAVYLNQNRFPATWSNLQQHSGNLPSLHKAFHHWFDGLKTMRLIHHLSATTFPVGGPEECIPPLLRLAGEKPAEAISSQLQLLQTRQRAQSDRYFTD